MPISVRQIYEQVCDALLEPEELSGQTITEEVFISMLNQAISDFISLGSYLSLSIIQAQLGVGIYTEPTPLSIATELMVDESVVNKSSGFFWDQNNYRWQLMENGTPQEWREDQLNDYSIEIRPKPAWTGYDIYFPTIGFYGVFSYTENATALDILCDPAAIEGLLGTISECDYGDVYVEFDSPMFGTIADMSVSELNITLVGIEIPSSTITSLDDFIPRINESFSPYLLFTVLNYIHSQDGEAKNTNLSKYYTARTEEGSRLVRAITEGK